MMVQSIDMAHSEVRALVAKAARGAGLSWGLAEEAGWSADWLARRGMPAADWATRWLAVAVEGGANPVEAGVALADRLGFGAGGFGPEALPDGLVAPGYLLAFVHLVAARHGPVEIVGTGGRVVSVDKDGSVRFGPGWSDRTSAWSIRPAGDDARTERVAVSASVVECLEGLALRTTVPASDQSRRDAGSASADND